MYDSNAFNVMLCPPFWNLCRLEGVIPILLANTAYVVPRRLLQRNVALRNDLPGLHGSGVRGWKGLKLLRSEYVNKDCERCKSSYNHFATPDVICKIDKDFCFIDFFNARQRGKTSKTGKRAIQLAGSAIEGRLLQDKQRQAICISGFYLAGPGCAQIHWR